MEVACVAFEIDFSSLTELFGRLFGAPKLIFEPIGSNLEPKLFTIGPRRGGAELYPLPSLLLFIDFRDSVQIIYPLGAIFEPSGAVFSCPWNDILQNGWVGGVARSA